MEGGKKNRESSCVVNLTTRLRTRGMQEFLRQLQNAEEGPDELRKICHPKMASVSRANTTPAQRREQKLRTKKRSHMAKMPSTRLNEKRSLSAKAHSRPKGSPEAGDGWEA